MTFFIRNFLLSLLLLGTIGCPIPSSGQVVGSAADKNGASKEEINKALNSGIFFGNSYTTIGSLAAGESIYKKLEQRYLGRLSANEGIEGSCIPNVKPGPIENYINKESREEKGGNECECLPFAPFCSANSCLCTEVCPNDSSIMAGRPDVVKQTAENTFAFINSSSYNKTVFANHPLTDGYCTGHSILEKKFQALGFFSSFGAYYTPGKKNIDPFTGEEIPIPGTSHYQEYIKRNIKRVAANRAGNFPGILNLKELSQNPTYQTLIGDLVAQDWAQYNALENTLAAAKGMGNYYTTDTTPQENAKLLERILSKVPEYSNISENDLFIIENDITFKSYKDEKQKKLARKKTWYRKGPWEKVSVNFWHEKKLTEEDKKEYIKDKTPIPKDGIEKGAHAISIWAYEKGPDGTVRLCVRDPNHNGEWDSKCHSTFEFIPIKGGYKAEYDGNRTIKTIRIPPYQEGLEGLIMNELVTACKQKYKGTFFNDNCKNN